MTSERLVLTDDAWEDMAWILAAINKLLDTFRNCQSKYPMLINYIDKALGRQGAASEE